MIKGGVFEKKGQTKGSRTFIRVLSQIQVYYYTAFLYMFDYVWWMFVIRPFDFVFGIEFDFDYSFENWLFDYVFTFYFGFEALLLVRLMTNLNLYFGFSALLLVRFHHFWFCSVDVQSFCSSMFSIFELLLWIWLSDYICSHVVTFRILFWIWQIVCWILLAMNLRIWRDNWFLIIF